MIKIYTKLHHFKNFSRNPPNRAHGFLNLKKKILGPPPPAKSWGRPCTYFNTSYLLRFLNLEYNKSDKNHVVSQMAHAKNIGEPFMAHAKNWYNIPCSTMLQVSPPEYKPEPEQDSRLSITPMFRQSITPMLDWVSRQCFDKHCCSYM